MYIMSLKTEVTKKFSSQPPVFYVPYGYLIEQRTIKRMRCVHEMEQKEHIENIAVFSEC